MSQSRPFLCLFSSFLNDTIQIEIDKSVDGVLGTQTQGGRMEGKDKSTELWRHPVRYTSFLPLFFPYLRSFVAEQQAVFKHCCKRSNAS